MMDMHNLTRAFVGVTAMALPAAPLAACGSNSSSQGASTDIPAAGTDGGTQLTLWTRSPLEAQVKKVAGLKQEWCRGFIPGRAVGRCAGLRALPLDLG